MSMANSPGATSANASPPTRSYQQEMLEASLKKNIVIAMDTGSGKTHIAILRMRIELEREPEKICWFLAPTVGLCEQQRGVISSSLPVSVGLISGSLEPKQWKEPRLWQAFLSTHRIVVSTPQVLLDALRHGYVRLGLNIALLVFDEAHHATDKHPYNVIMREFYDKCPERLLTKYSSKSDVRPYILGLTASPIFGGNVERSLTIIEKNLDSIILAPRNTRNELAQHVHRPEFKYALYPEVWYPKISASKSLEPLKAIVRDLNIKEDPFVIFLQNNLQKHDVGTPEYNRLDQQLSKTIDRRDTFTHNGLKDFLRTAEEISVDVGPWGADWYIQNVVQKALRSADSLQILTERNQKERSYLLGILRKLHVHEVSYDPRAILTGVSEKAQVLVKVLLSEKVQQKAMNEDYRGLVFVTRRDTVLVLAELLRHHPFSKDSFSVGCLLGNSEGSRRNSFLGITRTLLQQSQSETLNDFRVGEKNVIVSTSVGEEGLDIQACGSVVRWDLPQNMVSWAQSRGRARQKRSSFVLMFQEGGADEVRLKKWEALEKEMVSKYLGERRHLEDLLKEDEKEVDEENKEFRVPETGATVTLNSVISHLMHFCAVLYRKSDGEQVPLFDINPPDYPEGFHSSPVGTFIPPNMGPFGATVTLPRLLPQHMRVYTVEAQYPTKQSARKHVAFKAYIALYRAGLLNEHLLPISDISATKVEAEVAALLEDVVKRESMTNVTSQLNPWIPEEPVLGESWWTCEVVIESIGLVRLLSHVEIPSIDREYLNSSQHETKCFFVTAGKLSTFSLDDIMDARHFTRRLFSIFNGRRLSWDDMKYSYLFLPPSYSNDFVWDERRNWAASTRPEDWNPSVLDRHAINAEDFGSRYSHPNDIAVVVDRYSGYKFYKFLRWRFEELSEEERDAILRRYSRWNITEVLPPLIEAEELSVRKNFLASQTGETQRRKIEMLRPQSTTVVLANEKDVAFALYLPSILHAVAVKLTVHSLRSSLFANTSLKDIPINVAQSALIAPVSREESNYQRLETLGDVVLKHIVAVQLFSEHPNWPEGFLSKMADHCISNACLARGAILRRLYRWIVRSPFLARKWKPEYIHLVSSISHLGLEDEQPEVEEDEGGSNENSVTTSKLSTKVLADVVEALIGAAYLNGGFEQSIDCASIFDIGIAWKSQNERITSILQRTEEMESVSVQLTYPEEMLNYKFAKKLLLVEGLMHASCQANYRTVSYERLEFLGDSVLALVVTDTIYHAPGKKYSPGQMHMRKAAMVNMHFLAFICLGICTQVESQVPKWEAAKGMSIATENRTVYLWQCLLHSSQRVLEEQASTFARFRRLKGDIDFSLGNDQLYPWALLSRLRAPKFFSDMIESLLGAVYLDSKGNVDVVREILETLGVLPILRRIIDDNVDVRHPISRISNWSSANGHIPVDYRFIEEEGSTSCVLLLGDEEITSLTEKSRGKATQEELKLRVAEKGITILASRSSEPQDKSQ